MIKVERLRSPQGNFLKEQFLIFSPIGVYFQSYDTIIAFKPKDPCKKTVLDSEYWDMSDTTRRYREQLLRESTDITQVKIDEGDYLLEDLNPVEIDGIVF